MQDLIHTFTFIMGGIASKSGKPYLKVSNGRSEFFVKIPKSVAIDEDTFVAFEEGDEIELKVRVLPGSETVTLVDVDTQG